ncbi:hypothetical protein KAR91_20455, partial [Candidatus Pacearchaeota archaeon]|nr:hypothetical protein [Candidatus Pacearchaeota archaeon]
EGRDIEAAEKKKQAKLPGGTTAEATLGGYVKQASPSFMEMPEIVEMAKRLNDGKLPKIKRSLRAGRGRALGVHKGGDISLRADIFEDPGLSEAVLAHEIGHNIDFLPHQTMKRGNILGRIASLKSFMKKDFGELLPNVEIRNELKKLTQIWSPFDVAKADKNYIKYRHSSKELYADALSVLINNPALLKKHAPGFYEGFFEYLDRKPEVKKVYDEIQNRQKDRKAVSEERTEIRRIDYRRGDAARALKEEQTLAESVERMKIALVDVNSAIVKKTKQAIKQGKTISPEDNPIFWLEEAAYTSSQAKEYLRDHQFEIVDKLEKEGIDIDDLADLLLFERVANERSDIANPGGLDSNTAQDELNQLKSKLGPEKFEFLKKAKQAFVKLRKDTVIPLLKESGMYSDELMTKIEDNEHYATFSIVDALEEKNGRGAGIGSHIYKQIGTLAAIESPYTATIMKDIALIRALNKNNAAKVTVDMMQKHYPDEIQKADLGPPTTLPGGAVVRQAIPPKDPKMGMIRVLVKGKVKAYYVSKGIAVPFNRNPSQMHNFWKFIDYANIAAREIFVVRNPGFWLVNATRDYVRAAVNLPGGNLLNFLPEYVKAIKPAFKEAFNVPEDITREMNRKKALLSIESKWGFVEEDTQLERMLYNFSLKPQKWNSSITAPISKLWDHWGNIGQGFERIPKVAGYRWLKDRTNLTDKEIASMIRGDIGSPDFQKKGEQIKWVQKFVLFVNPMIQGWHADINVAKDRPAEVAFKRFQYTIAPKLMMYALAAGFAGAWYEEMMGKVSEYDKSNYTIIPLAETSTGKAVYLRLPQDETGRLIGGIVWKMMNTRKKDDLAQVLDYTAGQVPGWSPWADIANDTRQYAAGLNPYDSFRGRLMIPDKEFAAGGSRRRNAFLRNIARKSGSGIVYKLPYDDIKRVKTDLEKILDFPVTGNILSRFVKVSNIGERQTLRDISQEVRKAEANRQLDIRDRIIDSVNAADGEVTTAEVGKLFREFKTEKLISPNVTGKQFRKMYQRYASKTADDPKIDAVINAATNKEKGALLKEYRETMPPAEFRLIKRQLLIEGHMTGGAIKESLEVK